jgi:hypothetical protein
MPSDLLVTSLSVSDSTISISATCDSMESAAEALIQLRSFDSAYDVQNSGVSEQEEENGKKKVYMDVTMTYVDTTAVVSEGTDDASTDGQTDTQSTN